MLNFRKLLHDFSPTTVKEGKHLLEASSVQTAKVNRFENDALKFCFEVQGSFNHMYSGQVEINPTDSEILYSACDCTKKYDCEHIASACLFLEANFDQVLADYAQNQAATDGLEPKRTKAKVKAKGIEKTLKDAQENAAKKACIAIEQESLQEYRYAQKVLTQSPFFYEPEVMESENAEIMILLCRDEKGQKEGWIGLQISIRLDSRSKPIQIPSIKEFLEAVNNNEPLMLASRKHVIGWSSFSHYQHTILKVLCGQVVEAEDPKSKDKTSKSAKISLELIGQLLNLAREETLGHRKLLQKREGSNDSLSPPLDLEPFFIDSFEQPLTSSLKHAHFEMDFQRLDFSDVKVMLEPYLLLEGSKVRLNQVCLLCSRFPGVLYADHYFAFDSHIQRAHLKQVDKLQDLIIPQPLLGTLIEIGLPALMNVCKFVNSQPLQNCLTLPIADTPKLRCELVYLNNKLEALTSFSYGKIEVPASCEKLESRHLKMFIHDGVVWSRDIWHEKKILCQLFSDFVFDESTSAFVARNERVVVDFMTRLVPAWREKVEFICPSNLLDQFTYDETQIEVSAAPSKLVQSYELKMSIKGPLEKATLNQIWDCVSSERPYLEIKDKKGTKGANKARFLVLNLDRMRQLARFMDDMGIEAVENGSWQKPLWTLAHLDEEYLQALPFEVRIDKKLRAIQEQLWGKVQFEPQGVPAHMKVSLRSYQLEGLNWLEKLRKMHLAGILADDMGLGKTLQAIVAISQFTQEKPNVCSLVVCPTSLLYNWHEEVAKFNPKLRAIVVDGTPNCRKKAIENLGKYDLAITSYSLMQKDIDHYKDLELGYIILDEAQHIKNRQTQNAKCVRLLQAQHKLAMTGTPIENALDEMWSLFDFLMPGFMSSYERFVEKYIKKNIKDKQQGASPLATLKRKIAPFVLRRMKSDVLQDLPAVHEIVYHCQLTPKQKQLYSDYAKSACKELSAMVEKQGFDKVRIHVLATLTRLKQICCHPAIFGEDLVEQAESAKYDLFWQVVENLVVGGHKAVVFSQYTKMLALMRKDLEERGIRYCYLDGSTKARMETVKKFNESEDIPIFLISLKAGGTGLNLTGADSVLHYDLWWNPAVEDQATDRVHRMGQTKRVSSYKLVTAGTIEEKIVELQNRKKGLVRQLVVDDEDAMEKLTWEEVLELLQT